MGTLIDLSAARDLIRKAVADARAAGAAEERDRLRTLAALNGSAGHYLKADPSVGRSGNSGPAARQSDDADPHAALYDALLEAVTEAREAGDDAAVPGLIAAYRDHLDDPDLMAAAMAPMGDVVAKSIGRLFLKAGKWDESKHPRGKNGKFIGRDRIEAAANDPAKAAQLREEVRPEDAHKLEAALKDQGGTVGRTKRGEARHAAGQRREKRAADHRRAGELADKVADGSATYDELHELGDHLEGLTLDKLHYLRARIPTEGRGRRKADLVAALRASLDDRRREAHAAELTPAPDAPADDPVAAKHGVLREFVASYLADNPDATDADVVALFGRGPGGAGPVQAALGEVRAQQGGGNATLDRPGAGPPVAGAGGPGDDDEALRESGRVPAGRATGVDAAGVGAGRTLDTATGGDSGTDAVPRPADVAAGAEHSRGGDPGKPVRFAAGKRLTPAERDEVIRSVRDVYRENGIQKDELKGYHRDSGDPIYGYPHAPEHFVRSDVTGAKVRHYVTLPDGRKAHPSELFPEIKQSDIDRHHGEQEAAAKDKERRARDKDARAAATKGDANAAYQVTRRPVEGSYFAQHPDGRFARVDGTDPEDVAHYADRGFVAATKPVGGPTPSAPTPEHQEEALAAAHRDALLAEANAPQPSPDDHDREREEAAADRAGRMAAWAADKPGSVAAEEASRRAEGRLAGARAGGEGTPAMPSAPVAGTLDNEPAPAKPARKPRAKKEAGPATELAPVLAAHAAGSDKLKNYLDAAIGNASPAAPGGGLHDAANPPPQLDPERVRKLRGQLAANHADMHAAGDLTPADDEAFGKVMEGLGVKPLHAAGETKPFDPETMESPAGVPVGTPVRVVRRGWHGLRGDASGPTEHESNYRRAMVEPAKSSQNPPTVVDDEKGIGDNTPVPATPAGGSGGKPMTTTQVDDAKAMLAERDRHATAAKVVQADRHATGMPPAGAFASDKQREFYAGRRRSALSAPDVGGSVGETPQDKAAKLLSWFLAHQIPTPTDRAGVSKTIDLYGTPMDYARQNQAAIKPAWDTFWAVAGKNGANLAAEFDRRRAELPEAQRRATYSSPEAFEEFVLRPMFGLGG